MDDVPRHADEPVPLTEAELDRVIEQFDRVAARAARDMLEAEHPTQFIGNSAQTLARIESGRAAAVAMRDRLKGAKSS